MGGRERCSIASLLIFGNDIGIIRGSKTIFRHDTMTFTQAKMACFPTLKEFDAT
jgi:hypothetical protein